MDFERKVAVLGSPVQWDASDTFIDPTQDLFSVVPADSREPRDRPQVSEPRLRGRLHAICVIYAFAPNVEQRMEAVDALEQLTIELARVFAETSRARGTI
ncbi:hypothetical protein [Phenylobacterium sp.]|uniref:hypothetical protein n=1 Tax=Phenylobacterium sp. TaxID=1871053 RepID=UPI002732395F|nr:hypothetical protein [Phenylobacterium sp.]MDP3659410.1 hypothetical protein [Phenylobacterium sp.]